MKMSQFEYRAYVTKVYDGDTITCDMDLGFGIYLKQQKFRLYGINAPELRGKDSIQGIASRDALSQQILNKNVIIHTMKDKKEKYGRYLGIIYLDKLNINQWLLDNHFAIKYMDKDNELHEPSLIPDSNLNDTKDSKQNIIQN